MKDNQLEKLVQNTREAVEETGNFIRNELGQVAVKEIELKSRNNLVSYVDTSAEQQLVKSLSKLLPESVFLTEEATIEQKKGDYRWVIDPLDGTTNFLHRIPYFAVSVALEERGEPIVAVVLNVTGRECFYAWKNGGSYLNDQRIHVSETDDLRDSLIATGFPYHDFSRSDTYFKTMKYFFLNTRGVRRIGAAAIDLAYVACGRFDAFYEYSLKPWDIAAGLLLIEEAGGKVSDFSGGNDFRSGREVIGSNEKMYDQFLKVIREAMVE